MTLGATTPVTNGTTSIPATGVQMQASAETVPSGFCLTGTQTLSYTEIGTSAGTILAKGADTAICTISVATVDIRVQVPAAATIGAYTGILSLTLPW